MKEEKKAKKYRQPDESISLDELKSFLWGAATRLRGQIDAAGYKEYIFPLLFFKRISDVYDEQFEGFVAEGGEEYAGMQAEELPIRIPDGAHWNDVREVTENVGQRLVEAFVAIEQANPGEEADGRVIGGLDGIFGPKDGWTNKAKMPDHIITSLIEDFSRYNLSLASCPADEMGQAYEYLVGKFADDAGNTAQEFYTNRTVVTLMAEILQPKPDESIYDPTCGSGGMLVKCLDFLRQKGQPWQGVKVFGQEINALTASIARMNLYLNGVEDFSIVREDTLAHPAFVDGSRLRKFDIVLANPPYSIKTWDREAFQNDKWGRNMWGTPIQARADYAFIQHIIASMDSRYGRCAILLPHGVLNREEDKEIRINHVKSDTIDAIIGLGRSLFYNSGLESFVFICSNNKPADRKNKILFIEAEKCTHKVGKQAYLFTEDVDKILKAYHNKEDIPGFSKHISIDEILENDGNLNIKSYVKAVDEDNGKSLQVVLENLSTCQNNLRESLCQLPFVEDGFVVSSFGNIDDTIDKSSWKKVKLSDVAEEYTVRIDNPSESEFDFFIGSDCIGQYDFRIHKRSDASTITSTQKGFSAGDYLLVRRSLYGSDFRERAPRADFDGVCSADIITIREKKDVVADGFLIYVLYQKSLWDFIVSNSNGGLTRRIKWKQLAEYEFYLPPIKEQKIIADKLWAAYRLKESYKKLLAATEEMVKSQFIEMFGNPYDGWKCPVRKLGDVYAVGTGGTPDRKNLDYYHGDIPWVKSTEVNYCELYDTEEHISVKAISESNCSLYSSGTILLAMYGQGITRGRVAILRNKATVNQAIAAIQVTNETESIFLYHLLKVNYDYIRNLAVGGNQHNLNLKLVSSIPIVRPERELQERFVSIAEQADKSGFVGSKSQFIEMFKDKQPNGIIKDLVDTNIKSVKKMYAVDDAIEYIDISSIESASRSISETTNCVVKSAPSRAQQCVEYGDILVSTVRPINRNIAVVTKKSSNLVASTGFCVLRPKESYREYLLSVVLTDKYTQKMCDKASGGLYPAVNNSDVLSYEIFIPDKEMLNRISALYNQADKSGFVGSKSQFIEMFKDVSYRVALEDVVYIKDDCRKPINDGVRSAMKDGELYPYYGATGVVDYINDYITNEQLLCIAEDCGNYKAGEESSYIINGKAWVNNHAHVVKPKDSCSIEYLHQYLKMLDLMPYVSGTTRLKLTQKRLKEIPVILPSMERQMKFVAFTNQADKSGKCYEYRLAS